MFVAGAPARSNAKQAVLYTVIYKGGGSELNADDSSTPLGGSSCVAHTHSSQSAAEHWTVTWKHIPFGKISNSGNQLSFDSGKTSFESTSSGASHGNTCDPITDQSIPFNRSCGDEVKAAGPAHLQLIYFNVGESTVEAGRYKFKPAFRLRLNAVGNKLTHRRTGQDDCEANGGDMWAVDVISSLQLGKHTTTKVTSQDGEHAPSPIDCSLPAATGPPGYHDKCSQSYESAGKVEYIREH